MVGNSENACFAFYAAVQVHKHLTYATAWHLGNEAPVLQLRWSTAKHNTATFQEETTLLLPRLNQMCSRLKRHMLLKLSKHSCSCIQSIVNAFCSETSSPVTFPPPNYRFQNGCYSQWERGTGACGRCEPCAHSQKKTCRKVFFF